jgi:TIR domain
MSSNSVSGVGNYVFISYSHADRRWLDRLLQQLRPLVRGGDIQVFSDKDIRVGDDWRNGIQVALDSTRVAILLISPAFLASDFIVDQELPPLLARAESKGATIIPVILASSLFEMMPALSRFQAANPPSRPLSAMRVSEVDKVLADLAREIHRIVNQGT